MKVLKIVLIVILAILIAATAGLLVYGATLNAPIAFNVDNIVPFSAPPIDISDGARNWYDMEFIRQNASTKSDAAAEMICYATMNQEYAHQYYFDANCLVESGDSQGYSFFAQSKCNGNKFYVSFANGGGLNYASFILYYGGLRESASTYNVTYNYDDNVFSASWPKKFSVTERNDSPYSTLYSTYSLFKIPIYFGGVYDTDCDSSLLIEDETSIALPTEQMPYYTVTFNCDLDLATKSAETASRMKDSLGDKLKGDIVFKKLSVTAEIWPCGVFRSLQVTAKVKGKYQNKICTVSVQRDFRFAYSDVDCSIAAKLRDMKLYRGLSETSKDIYTEEIAAYRQAYPEY